MRCRQLSGKCTTGFRRLPTPATSGRLIETGALFGQSRRIGILPIPVPRTLWDAYEQRYDSRLLANACSYALIADVHRPGVRHARGDMVPRTHLRYCTSISGEWSI